MRDKGADFIAFPVAALWWLDKYAEFGRHLQTRYHEIARDEEVGTIYALSDDAPTEEEERASNGAGHAAEGSPANVVESDRDNGRHEETDDGGPEAAGHTGREALDTRSQGTAAHTPPPDARRPASAYVDDELLEDLHKIFDPLHYGEQLETDFAAADDAMAHYLAAGPSEAANPHPLFDTGWYLTRYPQVRISGENPLVHFLRHGWADDLDPSPYFDTQYYYSQKPTLREEGGSALVHYVGNTRANNAAHPNPLFHDSFYVSMYRDSHAEVSTPFEALPLPRLR